MRLIGKPPVKEAEMRAKTDAVVVAAALIILGAGGPASAASSSQDQSGAEAPKTDLQDKKGDLSEKLDKSNGVIHPQGAVDPGMDKKAPAIGDTPVIPPPGAPGSGTTAQPK
jgi:hypothetical protein